MHALERMGKPDHIAGEIGKTSGDSENLSSEESSARVLTEKYKFTLTQEPGYFTVALFITASE